MSSDSAPVPPAGPPKRSSGAKVVDYGMITVILVALGFAAYMQFGVPDSSGALHGEPAPDFNLKTLAGNVDGPTNHTGKVIVLDFWATWCRPCLDQMPHLAELEQDPELEGRIEILSINTDAPSPRRDEEIRRFLRSGGWTWDPLIDNGQVSTMYRVSAFPTIVVIAEDGTIHYARSGVHSAEMLRDLVDDAGAS